MPIAKLKAYLDSKNIPYVTITHSPAYTAQGIAALVHIPGQDLAKTVIIRLDDKLAMAVLPASRQVDLTMLRAGAGAKTIALATEAEFRERFPDCETGAMPPFGNLYNLPVFMEEGLAQDKEIAFNAGSHRELIRMNLQDYLKLVEPSVLDFARVRTAA